MNVQNRITQVSEVASHYDCPAAGHACRSAAIDFRCSAEDHHHRSEAGHGDSRKAAIQDLDVEFEPILY